MYRGYCALRLNLPRRTKRRLPSRLFIEPGKPDQNAFIERFNRTYREEVLDAYVFDPIEQVREVPEIWLREYNEAAARQSRVCASADVVAPFSIRYRAASQRMLPISPTSASCWSGGRSAPEM